MATFAVTSRCPLEQSRKYMFGKPGGGRGSQESAERFHKRGAHLKSPPCPRGHRLLGAARFTEHVRPARETGEGD